LGRCFLTTPAAASGYPHITVPCGKVYELPIGFSFFGTAYSEPELIGLAYAFEQASNNRINLVSRNLFIETPSNKTCNN
jgi:amidase